MHIKSAVFVKSSSDIKDCPKPSFPEFAFIGRSNVGKSSLINMLVDKKDLAKTSATPGKTQLINHFLINDKFYIVDLPGYGYAKVSKQTKKGFDKMISNYLLFRESLMCTFVLVDIRHEAQPIDIEFINFLGENEIPLAIIFTKSDKINKGDIVKNVSSYKKVLKNYWSELPPLFITSSVNKSGREELLHFIIESCKNFIHHL
ncbi:MAG: ribosome biogenesis GTP-binding protein YihA/YsxC [Bacteroidia bacterium]